MGGPGGDHCTQSKSCWRAYTVRGSSGLAWYVVNVGDAGRAMIEKREKEREGGRGSDRTSSCTTWCQVSMHWFCFEVVTKTLPPPALPENKTLETRLTFGIVSLSVKTKSRGRWIPFLRCSSWFCVGEKGLSSCWLLFNQELVLCVVLVGDE